MKAHVYKIIPESLLVGLEYFPSEDTLTIYLLLIALDIEFR